MNVAENLDASARSNEPIYYDAPGTGYCLLGYSPGGQGRALPELPRDGFVRRHWANEEAWLELLNSGDEALAHAIREWHMRKVDMTTFGQALKAATCRALPHEYVDAFTNEAGRRLCLCCIRPERPTKRKRP